MTRRRNLRQHIEEFSGNTTFHGAHFVLGADRGIIRRVFWLLLILTGLGFLTKQLVESYNKLQAKEHVITKEMLSVEENGLKFPAVTICNANMMQGTEIKDSDGADAKAYLDQLNPLNKMLSIPNKTLDSSFDIKKAVLRFGHKAEDMIRRCAWDGKLCSHLNFTTRFSQMYGLCHTFNSGKDGHPLLYSTSIRRSHGLHMLININKDSYYGVMSYLNPGIRMAIHGQEEEPMIESDGIDIMPGHMTTIKIQNTEYISLRAPYKSACGWKDLKTSKVYTQSRCLMECSTRKAIQKCGCILLGMSELPEFNGTKYCTPNEMISCGLFLNASEVGDSGHVSNILFEFLIKSDTSFLSGNPKECVCPKNCTHIAYKIAQINAVSLISDSFWKEFYKNKVKAMKSFKAYFGDNLALLVLQYDDLYTHKSTEREAYDINDFGSDVGGYLGLFLGCSILTVFEVFDFIVNFLFGKQKNKNEVGQSNENNEADLSVEPIS